MTPLCEIAYKYKTDKCPQIGHSYTPFYYQLLKDKRDKIKKIFEMGIGYPECMISHSGLEYVTGASLYMWRDFFPNAQIYGADIEPKALFEAERIETFLCNELKKSDLEKVIKKTGSDIDLFIDDGTHYYHEQVFLCKNMMSLLKDDVIYVIEDVRYPPRVLRHLKEFDCFVPKLLKAKRPYRNNLIVVRKK